MILISYIKYMYNCIKIVVKKLLHKDMVLPLNFRVNFYFSPNWEKYHIWPTSSHAIALFYSHFLNIWPLAEYFLSVFSCSVECVETCIVGSFLHILKCCSYCISFDVLLNKCSVFYRTCFSTYFLSACSKNYIISICIRGFCI